MQRIALCFAALFASTSALAEDLSIPPPSEMHFWGGTFCTSEESLMEVWGGLSSDKWRDEKGCGELFVPMDFTVTPLYWVEYENSFLLMTRLTDKWGETIFIFTKDELKLTRN